MHSLRERNHASGKSLALIVDISIYFLLRPNRILSSIIVFYLARMGAVLALDLYEVLLDPVSYQDPVTIELVISFLAIEIAPTAKNQIRDWRFLVG